MSALDSIDLSALQKAAHRRERCAQSAPKILFGLYIATAITLTFLCLTVFRSSLLASTSGSTSISSSSSSSSSFSIASTGGLDLDSGELFSSQAYCQNSNDKLCSNSVGSWCCANTQSCGSSYNTCNANVGLIIGIILAVWLGPLFIYLMVIAIVRCSQVGRFQSLANSGRYQSWVIVSGCFQMSIDSSSGDAEFNQAAFSLINTYGGCGDECVMHCIGIWCFGFCYPCCMCCVSAGRNQTKVGTIQNALLSRGYSTNVQFLSSIVPACCNSIFIGLLQRQAMSNIMVVASPQVYSQQVIYTQPAPSSPMGYVQQPIYVQQPYPSGQYPQPQYAPAPGYAPQPMYSPQYAAPAAAPAYTAVPGSDVMSSVTVAAQPPEVVKPQA